MKTNVINGNTDSFSNVCTHEKSFGNKENIQNVTSSQSNISLSTQQKLELSSWGLPEKVLEFYKKKGITHMFQWQLECLTLGEVLNAGNLVYSAPTSAGKTLVAEILISKTIFELQKKALVILPFVSVVREKMFYFQGMYTPSGMHVEGYMGGHSPSISFKQVNVAVCTIEKANVIVNRLLEDQSLHNLGLVVVDELHLLGDSYRGYLLELLLTKLKYISLKSEFKIQIVGMSATLPNLKCLADWLNADLYYTDFRPVPLSEKLKCGAALYDKKLNKLTDLVPLPSEASDDSENVGQLCLETIANGHSVLIFCPTKVWCENLAEKIAQFFKKNGCSKSAETEGTPGWILRKELDLNKINEVIEHLTMSPVGLDKDLVKTITFGVAFHHAGLTLDERDIIEGSFRKGSIRVLCATSTLSSGVNLPARRVIIRSPMSFGGLMDILTYRQMIGRAGRMGVDSEGESILISKPSEKVMCQTLMCSNLKPIESCLGHGRLSASLKRALLEIIASGIAANPDEVKKYASCTFLAFSSKHDIEDPIQSCMEFLEENEFIRLQENGTIYVPTPLAKACLASSLPPDEGLALFRELQRARRCFVLDSDLHIIYQVTPYSVSEQWSKIDWLSVLNMMEGLPPSMKRVGEMVGVEEAFLVRIVKGSLNPNTPENRNKLSIHRRFYTALALQDLVNEVPLSEVATKYECNKGMLQSLQQSAATYAGMVTEFTKRLGWSSVELIFSQFQERLQFGIQRELCELMRLPLLNAKRARTLYNAGFTSLSAIAKASVTDLENALFAMAPFQSKKEIAGETAFDKDQRNKLETIWITGKADLSIRQAAELLLAQSRNILELELGLEGVQWGKKEHSTVDKTPNKSFSIIKNVIDISTVNNSHISLNVTNNRENKTVVNTVDTETKSVCDNLNENPEKASSSELIVCSEKKVENENFTRGDLKVVEERSPVKVFNKNDVVVNEVQNHQSLNIKKTDEKPIPKDVTDYFASSFNFDVVPDYTVSEKRNENIVLDSDNGESDSSSSVEILYDSTLHNSSKNLSISRLSEDLFEISRRGSDSKKKMSTPIPRKEKKSLQESDDGRNRFEDTRSPDLFSQSLTFDTQLGRILDFDEKPCEEAPLIVNPSTSFNSDDLGFVSDLSPQKPKKLEEKGEKNTHNASMSASFVEKGFKSPLERKKEEINKAVKRKIKATDSPDLIVDPDECLLENSPTKKRLKIAVVEDKVVSSPHPSKGNRSDDEIMPTPKIDKTSLSNISRFRSNSIRSINQSIMNRTAQRSMFLPPNIKPSITNGIMKKAKSVVNTKSDALQPSPKSDGVNWDKVNVIDISEKEEFRFFCERLKEENILGLALACRRKIEEKKNVIGMKIMKKKKSENVKETIFSCQYKDIVLDGIAFYWKGNDVYYMPLDDGNVPLESKIDLLRSLCLEKKTCRMYDSKEQMKMLYRCCTVLLTCSYQDPKVAYWLLSENWKEKNFPSMALDFVPKSKTLVSQIGAVVGYSSPGLLIRSGTFHKTRACLEAFLTYHIIKEQLPLLSGKGLLKAFEQTEMPIMINLAEMELNGFQICRNGVSQIMSKLDSAKEALEEKAFSIAQHRFSLSSSIAVSKVLFKQLGLETENFALTKKRKLPSTNKQVLEDLANETKHPLPGIILQWRKIRSMTTKFVSPLLQISTESERVFGISQTYTVSGRISMHEPNLQNIPKEFTLDYGENETMSISLRDVFLPSKNCILLSVDYCQIELRMLAHLSQDEKLITDITGSSDIFINIASTIYGVPHYDVDDSLRQRAKQTCYGIIYGIGPRTLSQQLGIEESDAMKLMEDFKTKYEGVTEYLLRTVNDCKKKGYILTLLNRRRYLPAINDSNQTVRMEAERQAVNTTIQGSAADLVKTAMIAWREKFNDKEVTARLVLHLHDELLFEVGEDAIELVAASLKDTMENAVELIVPTPVKIRTGASWGQLKNFDL